MILKSTKSKSCFRKQRFQQVRILRDLFQRKFFIFDSFINYHIWSNISSEITNNILSLYLQTLYNLNISFFFILILNSN